MLQEARGDVAGHPSYRRYHYAEGPLSVTDAAGTRYIGTDALGSAADLTTSTGVVAAAHQYDAWGEYRNGTAPASADPKLGYTGHQYDPETGLVYARARHYDPEYGVFISRDSYEGTLSDGPSLHRFAYSYGNPLTYSDEDGHSATAIGAAAGFFWGFGQMVGGMAQDVHDCSVGSPCAPRSTGDYLSLWGQNIIGGLELGMSIDVGRGGGFLAASASGALGVAGFDALTFDGRAREWKDVAVSQVVEGGKGAAAGAVLGSALRGGGAALRWAGQTSAGQTVVRVAQEAVGKVAQTAVGQSVSRVATAAGEKVAGAAGRVGGWFAQEGAVLDAAAAEVGLGGAVQAPRALGQALQQAEARVTGLFGAKAAAPAGEAAPALAPTPPRTPQSGLDPLPRGTEPYPLDLFPKEAYKRVEHYGYTPTAAQRASVPPGMEFDHSPMLVQHFYEGPGGGRLAGFNMTQAEREAFASRLSSGGSATATQQRAQGAAAAAYSKRMKRLWGLE